MATGYQQQQLQETNIAIENPPIWWYLPGKSGIFMGYVSFREGSSKNCTTSRRFFLIRPDVSRLVDGLLVEKGGGDTWRTGDDGWRIMKKDYQAPQGEPGSCD